MPDDEVARRVGRTRMAVQKRRFRLRIECKRPERPQWTEEELALLGTLPDAELAKRLQCPARRVTYKRKSLQIPPFPPAERFVKGPRNSESSHRRRLPPPLCAPKSWQPAGG